MTGESSSFSHRLAYAIAVGESAVRVTGRTGSSEHDWRLAHKLAAALHDRDTHVYTGALPTYESVLVEFNPIVTDLDHVFADLNETLDHLKLDEPLNQYPRHFKVPVSYGTHDGEEQFGPDMRHVAELTGIGAGDIIARHCQPTYVVRCLGAPGGSPMLDGPNLGIPVPRLTSPRTKVPQGSVSLAGRQATITPAEAPGGWCVIGRTPLRILDLSNDPLVPYRPGDTLQFFPIGVDEFRAQEGRLMAPEVTP